MLPRVTAVADLSTPALVVDTTALVRNLEQHWRTHERIV